MQTDSLESSSGFLTGFTQNAQLSTYKGGGMEREEQLPHRFLIFNKRSSLSLVASSGADPGHSNWQDVFKQPQKKTKFHQGTCQIQTLSALNCHKSCYIQTPLQINPFQTERQVISAYLWGSEQSVYIWFNFSINSTALI